MAIINRLDHANSKEKIGLWAKNTIFSELLNFRSSKLNSKSFWYVTDDVINEKELRKYRQENDCLDDIFAGLNDENFKKMSIGLIKEELQDLKLIAMIYKDNDYETKVTNRSTVQQKLFDVLNQMRQKTGGTMR